MTNRKLENTKYFVTMTDKYLSNFKDDKISKFVVECDTFEQAQLIADNAKDRSEMKHININGRVPYYSPKMFNVTHINVNELGSRWTTVNGFK